MAKTNNKRNVQQNDSNNQTANTRQNAENENKIERIEVRKDSSTPYYQALIFALLSVILNQSFNAFNHLLDAEFFSSSKDLAIYKFVITIAMMFGLFVILLYALAEYAKSQDLIFGKKEENWYMFDTDKPEENARIDVILQFKPHWYTLRKYKYVKIDKILYNPVTNKNFTKPNKINCTLYGKKNDYKIIAYKYSDNTFTNHNKNDFTYDRAKETALLGKRNKKAS